MLSFEEMLDMSMRQNELRKLYYQQQKHIRDEKQTIHTNKHQKPIICECGKYLKYDYNLPYHLGTNGHYKKLQKKLKLIN
jgi:hypothetical protein